ncbi:MAG: hypothetical protein O3A51_03420, partial [Verrucomicrobia bacterium]|nr:hypothetical protein [Verrucomicrobiota bacterium]
MRRVVIDVLAVWLVAMGAMAAHEPTAAPSARMTADLRALNAFSTELAGMRLEMAALQMRVGVKTRGYYSSDEHDQVASLLFRYLACRDSLWDLIRRYGTESVTGVADADQIRGFLISLNAAVQLSYYSSLLVETFLDEPPLIEKLNEEYHRYNIPRGTYDTLLRSVTAIDHLEALRAARVLYMDECTRADSPLAMLIKAEPDYARLADRIDHLHPRADEQINNILQRRSLVSPAIRNRLRHSSIGAFVRAAKTRFGDNIGTIRGVLFLNISRLKTPGGGPLNFTSDQVAHIFALLQPGDIVLTFTAGYMSNVFLPGAFKHGITYVGPPAQRRAVGLTSDAAAAVIGQRRESFVQN